MDNFKDFFKVQKVGNKIDHENLIIHKNRRHAVTTTASNSPLESGSLNIKAASSVYTVQFTYGEKLVWRIKDFWHGQAFGLVK